MGPDDELQPGTIRRLGLLGLAGTSIEWYDFFLYGVGAALVFPGLFFPKSMPHSLALIASFLTFGFGFIARPIGGLVFGHIGDRMGRTSALAIALLLMGVSTTLIACLPGYATIGATAPILLVVLRIAQGLAIGGQWGGAMLLVVESAPRRHRGFYGSFPQVGVPVGVVLANLAFLAASALTSPEHFLIWGWRIPFLFSLVLVGLGLYVHFRVEETPAYRALMDKSIQARGTQAASPLRDMFHRYPRMLVLATLSHIAINLCFYISITYVMSFGTDAQGLNLPRTTMLAAVLLANAVLPPMMLAGGALSDRIGRRRTFMMGAVFTVAGAFVLFPLLATKSFVLITLGVLCVSVPVAMMYGPQSALFSELFPTHVRYSAASFSYQTGAILGGGFAPLVATALLARFQTPLAVSCYMAAGCVISLLAVLLMRETSGDSLHGERS